MPEHTPTPWTTDKSGPNDIFDASVYGTRGTLSVLVAEVMEADDAAFIVKAVNCHDELAAIVQAFLEASSNKDGSWIGGYFLETDDLMKVHARARAALSKAEAA